MTRALSAALLGGVIGGVVVLFFFLKNTGFDNYSETNLLTIARDLSISSFDGIIPRD